LGGLGLDDLRRRGDSGHDQLGIVEKRDAFRRGEVGDPQRVAKLHAGDVELDPLRHLERQSLDGHLAQRLREHADLTHARRVVAAAGGETPPPPRPPGASSPPTSSPVTEALIARSRRTSWRSTCVTPPRTGSTWYSLRIDACVWPLPSISTSRIECRPDAPVSARRSSRSAMLIEMGSPLP